MANESTGGGANEVIFSGASCRPFPDQHREMISQAAAGVADYVGGGEGQRLPRMKRTGQQHSTNGVAGVPAAAAVRGAAALAILLFSGAGPAEAIGYLPLLGPGPLRFQAPPRPATAAALPPLSMGESRADKPDQAATKPAPTNDTASVADKVTSANPNLLETKTAAAATPNPIMVLPIPVRPGASGPPPVSAQALLKFFQANPTDTNRSDAAVLLPLEFVPPTPFGPPASKTTFEIK